MARLRRSTVLLAIAWLAAAGSFAGGHSDLVRVIPEPGAAHAGPPTEIVLEFTEPVEARFSTFDLYLLDVGPSWPVDPRAPSDAEWARLEMLAGAFAMRTRLARSTVPGGAHVAALASRARGATRSIHLEPAAALAPGAYVLSWATVATDGHVMTGQTTFLIVEGR